MKEKWPYLALVMVLVSSCYQEINIIKMLLLFVIIIRIVQEDNLLLLVIIASLTIVLFGHLFWLESYHNQQMALIGKEQQATLQINVNDVTLNGDLLTGYAILETEHQSFWTTIYYKVTSEKEKKWLSEQKQDVLIIAQVSFDAIEGRRNVKTFDYAKFLKSQKVVISTTIRDIEQMYPLIGWKVKGHKLRYQLMDKVRQDSNGPITDYALALIFGEKKHLSQEDLAVFKELGIMHLLAISGLHVMILVNLLERLLWRSGLTREMTQWVIIVVLVGYGWLICWNISGARAIGIVLLQIIYGKLFNEKLSTMDALSILATVNCLKNPYIMNSSAFQLSYGICFFVILVNRMQVCFVKNQFSNTLKKDYLLKNIIRMGLLCLLIIPLIAKYFY